MQINTRMFFIPLPSSTNYVLYYLFFQQITQNIFQLLRNFLCYTILNERKHDICMCAHRHTLCCSTHVLMLLRLRDQIPFVHQVPRCIIFPFHQISVCSYHRSVRFPFVHYRLVQTSTVPSDFRPFTILPFLQRLHSVQLSVPHNFFFPPSPTRSNQSSRLASLSERRQEAGALVTSAQQKLLLAFKEQQDEPLRPRVQVPPRLRRGPQGEGADFNASTTKSVVVGFPSRQ